VLPHFVRAWMFGVCVCVRFSVFVLSCVLVDALRRADHQSKESYRLWKMFKTLRNQPYALKMGASSKVWSKRREKTHSVPVLWTFCNIPLYYYYTAEHYSERCQKQKWTVPICSRSFKYTFHWPLCTLSHWTNMLSTTRFVFCKRWDCNSSCNLR
jgi:hypothetical protein